MFDYATYAGHTFLSESVSHAKIDTRERVFNLVGGADQKEGRDPTDVAM